MGMYMSSIIRFPYFVDHAKESYIEIFPIATIHGYGLKISNNLVLTAGHNESEHEYIRKEFEFVVLQRNLKDTENIEIYHECIENFYYNNILGETAITVFSMLLLEYFPDMVESLGIRLHPQIVNVETKKKTKVGYGL